MCENGTKTKEKEVTYPYEMDKRGKRQIYGWFGNNHENAKYLMVLPKPTDVDISLKHHEAKEGSNNRKSNGEKKKENDSRKSKE